MCAVPCRAVPCRHGCVYARVRAHLLPVHAALALHGFASMMQPPRCALGNVALAPVGTYLRVHACVRALSVRPCVRVCGYGRE